MKISQQANSPTQKSKKGFWEDREAASRRQYEIAQKLIKEQNIPFATAFIIAGDMVSAEKATEAVKNKEMTAEEALLYVGSYARFDWAVEHLPHEILLKMLPELWVGADPDDTNLFHLKLWKEAYRKNGNKIITDGESLPDKQRLKIYRGQIGNVKGISWSLDKGIAQKFADTGGYRQKVKGGKVLEAFVKRNKILAYLTGRKESEIIVDPAEIEL